MAESTEEDCLNLPGNVLEDLCASASSSVVLAAPFIKRNVLDRLLSHIPELTPVNCITRWRPEEIFAGVSDIEVWNIIEQREFTSLRLQSNLHAKYYRVDGTCLVGSANLTRSGLGWASNSNLELLVEIPFDHADLDEFEKNLVDTSVRVTETMFNHLSDLLGEMERFRIEHPTEPIATQSSGDAGDVVKGLSGTADRGAWVPLLRRPEKLYPVYLGQFGDLMQASLEAAAKDLRGLDVPPGMDEREFVAYVGFLLLQEPLFQRIDDFVIRPRRFGEVSALLARLLGGTRDDLQSDITWQTIMRWLLYFLPNLYERSQPNYTEVFARRRP